jgi:hypothetical protein
MLSDKTASSITQQDYQMDQSLENRIRERAYEIWTAHGIDGQADQHWLAAEREISWSTKCYMNMRPLYQPQLMQTEAVA